jgi:hypothetical protein
MNDESQLLMQFENEFLQQKIKEQDKVFLHQEKKKTFESQYCYFISNPTNPS